MHVNTPSLPKQKQQQQQRRQGFHPTLWSSLTTTLDGPEVAIFKNACARNKLWGVFSLTGALVWCTQQKGALRGGEAAARSSAFFAGQNRVDGAELYNTHAGATIRHRPYTKRTQHERIIIVKKKARRTPRPARTRTTRWS